VRPGRASGLPIQNKPSPSDQRRTMDTITPAEVAVTALCIGVYRICTGAYRTALLQQCAGRRTSIKTSST